MRRRPHAVVLAAMIAGGLVAAVGETDEDVDLSSALELWGSVLRDVDQFGFRLTRISTTMEMEIGARMASAMSPGASNEHAWTAYVTGVGETMVPNVRRRGIQYTFAVVEHSAVAAFAGPGGRIYVTTGLLEFVESEAELAAILGHEIAHVDLRHCIERLQYRVRMQQLGLDNLPLTLLHEVGRWLIAAPYSKYQEMEADAQGLRLATSAGYDPRAAPSVLARMAAARGAPPRGRARTPVHEIGRAIGSALDAYGQSHPPAEDRIDRLERYLARHRQRLAGREYYVGRENHRRRIPHSQETFPGERQRL